MTYYLMHVRRWRTASLDCKARDRAGDEVVLAVAIFDVDWKKAKKGTVSYWQGLRGRYGLVMEPRRKGKPGQDLDATHARFFKTPEERSSAIRRRWIDLKSQFKLREANRARAQQRRAMERARSEEERLRGNEDREPTPLLTAEETSA